MRDQVCRVRCPTYMVVNLFMWHSSYVPVGSSAIKTVPSTQELIYRPSLYRVLTLKEKDKMSNEYTVLMPLNVLPQHFLLCTRYTQQLCVCDCNLVDPLIWSQQDWYRFKLRCKHNQRYANVNIRMQIFANAKCTSSMLSTDRTVGFQPQPVPLSTTFLILSSLPQKYDMYPTNVSN